MNLLIRLFKELRLKRAPGRPTLFELFLRNQGNDINKWHHYFQVYEKFLSPFRGQPVSLLEIGLFRGGSLQMWRNYFGGLARIAGMDIVPNYAELEQDGYRIFIGDQADRDFLRGVRDKLGEIDIVIDDGGHRSLQQINSFEELYPITRRFYIVEDTHTSYWPDFTDAGSPTFIDYAKQKIDILHEWHKQQDSYFLYNKPPAERPPEPAVSEFCKSTLAIHFYDSMVVFEKGDNQPRRHEIR